jgi:predicted Na+-dependent transporter
LTPLEALALFLYGCSPGGSASNNWTILFDGDIDLSAIMTFASTITSLGKCFSTNLNYRCIILI